MRIYSCGLLLSQIAKHGLSNGKNGEIYHISPQYWQQNQQQQALLLRYFALPLKEDEHHLWLAVDSLNNLAACETFAFKWKISWTILFETAQLKQLYNPLHLKPIK